MYTSLRFVYCIFFFRKQTSFAGLLLLFFVNNWIDASVKITIYRLFYAARKYSLDDWKFVVIKSKGTGKEGVRKRERVNEGKKLPRPRRRKLIFNWRYWKTKNMNWIIANIYTKVITFLIYKVFNFIYICTYIIILCRYLIHNS